MRKYYLDNIRWITILLVVVYHVVMIFSGILHGMGLPFKDVQYQDGVMYVLYPWFMILLFIVSGMSSRYYLEKHSLKDFVRVRTRKLLVPSTIGVLVAGCLQGYISMSIANAFDTIPETLPGPILVMIMILSGQGVLWFIQMLWIFSMMLALVRKFEKGKLYALTEKTHIIVIILMGIPLWLSGQILNTPVITVYRFGIYAFAFFIGYFVFAHDEVIERISRLKFVFIAGAVILGTVYLYMHFGENFAVMPLVGSVEAVAFAWITILAVFGSAYSWGNKRGNVSAFVSGRSWGIYIFHYLCVSGTALLLRRYTGLSELPCYLITAMAGFGGSILLYEIISRIPVLRWCVLGVGKDKMNVQG
ncbi:MAG: acyltransferase [Lachnospiraceae bacterium]|nr:acyltransferase [Lachnospiraceae bacterium]